MVTCSLLKYLKIFYLSLSTFHSSSVLVKDNTGKTVAIQNIIRSNPNIFHKYTFISNSSYRKCFKQPHSVTFLYNNNQNAIQMVSFPSSVNPQRPRSTSSPSIRVPTPPLVNPTPIKIKPVSRSSNSIRPYPKHNDGDTSSSDEE